MFGVDRSAGQAPLYVPGYVLLHAELPVIRAKIPVHLRRPGMDVEPRLVGLIHQNLSYSAPVRNPDPPMQGQQPLVVVIK